LLAVLAKPTGIVLGPCLDSYLLCKRRPAGRWIAPLCGTAVGLLIYFAYNWAPFKNPFDFGRPETFALRIVPCAIAGTLISPGRGLLWYSPPVVAVAAAPGAVFKRWEGRLIVAVAGAYLAEHSIWVSWAGGWSWGATAAAGNAGVDGAQRTPRAAAALVTGYTDYRRFHSQCAHDDVFLRAVLPGSRGAKVSAAAQTWNPRYAPAFRIWGAAGRETADAYRKRG
jgi:hypothetical protein